METWPARTAVAVALACATVGAPASRLEAQDPLHDSRVRDAVDLLDRWVEAKQAYEQFPGLSSALVYDQTVLLARGYGYADVERKRPATPETPHDICSLSLFTSAAAIQVQPDHRNQATLGFQTRRVVSPARAHTLRGVHHA